MANVDYLGKGNDDGENFGRSDGKIGFYGLAAPIVKATLTVDCTASSTIITVATAYAELKDAICNLGLLTNTE